ncbi:MAG: hypothetical protein DRP79_00365 [Planctomycetota bacterium]|nr:MAG: hypothetical protein DRP79_00365 [Planctomycetota bacterium]
MKLPKFERLKKIFHGPSNKRLSDGKPKTLIAMIALTYRCQCKCKHCGSAFYEKKKENELSTDKLRDLIGQFAEVGAGSTAFFGGEPLIRDDIFQLISLAKKRGMGTVIDTNAYALDAEMARRLAQAGLDMAMVSIDSSRPEVHDELRGVPGIFDRAVAAIKHLKENGIEARIGTYVDREKLNNGDFQAILNLGRELGAKVRVLAPVLAGKWSKMESLKLTPEEIDRFKKMLVPGESFWEQEECDSCEKNFICDAARKNSLYVTAYGDVCPCAYIPLSFGNVREERLADILKRMWSHDMFKRLSYNDCPMNDPEFNAKYVQRFRNAESFPVKVE